MHIETSGAGQSKDCANLFRFLAFSGLRIDEARHVVWKDVDFEKSLIHARITKNGKDRWIPLNSSLRQLLEKMRSERIEETPDKIVMQVFECQKSIDRAASIRGFGNFVTTDSLAPAFVPAREFEAGAEVVLELAPFPSVEFVHPADEFGVREAVMTQTKSVFGDT